MIVRCKGQAVRFNFCSKRKESLDSLRLEPRMQRDMNSLLRVPACTLFSPQGNDYWSARLEMCQWIRETLDKESIWDEARSTNLSRW
jgi:hypothetical protein